MFARLTQLSRHLPSAQSITQAVKPAAFPVSAGFARSSRIMVSADERNTRTIHTAACLIIGDEVLGGKTVDTNSAYMAKWCFSLGINLKRVEVIEDDESEIVEAVRRMSDRYDFVVTSGGIGPTHDDITYQSIAKAFDLPLVLNQEAFEKMKKLSKPHPGQPNFDWDVDSPALQAKLRMVILPTDEKRDPKKQFVFPHEDLWVPVNVVNGNVHILPGVPRLFEKLLDGLKPGIVPRLTDPEGKGLCRVLISTPLPESAVAGYLTQLAAKVEPKGVKVGSYPRWGQNGTVTLVGRDQAYIESIVAEVVQGVEGKRVNAEGEDDTQGEAGKDLE
ncbi:molybdenum cofactor synthesis domain-containing protein [Colletotrichum scovillei]|uniref:Molybdenum cofactor synthesis domain-containing protein n=2 Tax=Colletotrichum acutatum species complex TaxID=2707335 RepID=A0A9P7UDG8_9PEZI|nr:molybdenum cofactor synthesis domain-containing protein [Colletotrichum scovillei]KXH38454.1 molybdenum cofactor synthesis domain-containing protein [Colletotrichum nymphaeae SA-01]KAF4778680.1 molybdenum cofactor synthesis domain-containing protein [Colletotrichum scovillei]KAG7044067.1 molybdenum cofactor synthesis domain-containing protein [Colletotrichum scovillei]KAG7046170.1 molybdenum cofactor synthesis domain-containing protein [Colletotrichum scovillei]KAG7063516.1 molybdenum cofac